MRKKRKILTEEEIDNLVFDLLGKEIATIVSEELLAGNYTREWNARNLASGIYFYSLQAGNFVETRKLILIK